MNEWVSWLELGEAFYVLGIGEERDIDHHPYIFRFGVAYGVLHPFRVHD